ncbi:MAG TPA: FkbM family methyltransferase [Candidatus Paceibacterota bacterium]|nr:FkbM family methyltransferase [Candidatus Paceibacterota bacterium]
MKNPPLLSLLNGFRSILYRWFAGKGIGKKFPFLWKAYDFFYRIFSRKNFVQEVNGVKLLIDLKEPDYHFRRILEDYSTLKEYEPNTVKVLKKHVRENDTVLDIGASIGPLSLVMSKLVGPAGKIYSFEPTPACFHYLCENIKLNKARNVRPYQIAAWDKDEPIRIQPAMKRRVWASGVKLDDFLNLIGVGKVDFIKMDIDGAEPFALKGLIRTIEGNPKLKMVVEYYPKYIKMLGGDPDEMKAILDKYFTYKPIEGDYGDGYWNFFCQRKAI